MDPTSLSVASSSFHLNASYVSSASDHLTESARVLQSILQHRKLPARGLSEHHISLIMHQIAAMDSNNFHSQPQTPQTAAAASPLSLPGLTSLSSSLSSVLLQRSWVQGSARGAAFRLW